MENTIQKLKTELLESEDQAIRERQELKSNFETDHKRKISQLTKDKDEQILLFKKELEITVNNMTQLKQSHVEEILSLEHSKQKNFTIGKKVYIYDMPKKSRIGSFLILADFLNLFWILNKFKLKINQ